MYPRFSCLLFGNPCVSPSSVTILNHVWFTIVPLSPFFPSHHPLLPPRALREDDWGRVRSCSPSLLVESILTYSRMTAWHSLIFSSPRSRRQRNISRLPAANMKYYLETLRHGSFEYEHWGAYATTTATCSANVTLKKEFALRQTSSRLFHFVQFVKCWQFFLELNSKSFIEVREKNI